MRKALPIFNTDQGSQFTADAFAGRLESCDVSISMDGRGRALDNVFIERLWRTVKYEEIHLKEYETAWEAESGLGSYFELYCQERPRPSPGLSHAGGVILRGSVSGTEKLGRG